LGAPSLFCIVFWLNVPQSDDGISGDVGQLSERLYLRNLVFRLPLPSFFNLFDGLLPAFDFVAHIFFNYVFILLFLAHKSRYLPVGWFFAFSFSSTFVPKALAALDMVPGPEVFFLDPPLCNSLSGVSLRRARRIFFPNLWSWRPDPHTCGIEI